MKSGSVLAIRCPYWISVFETSICGDARIIVDIFLGLNGSDKSAFPNTTIAIKPAFKPTDTGFGRT